MTKNAKMLNVRRRVLPKSIRVYFTKREEGLITKLEALSDSSGMTVSRIGVLAVRLGLPLVAKNFEGMMIDDNPPENGGAISQ